MQQISVHRKRGLATFVFGHGDLVLFGIGDKSFTGVQIPFTPWRDHANIRIAGIVGQLKPHLVIALTGGAVTYGVGTCRCGNLNLAFGDEWAGNRRAEQIHTLIKGVGAKHWKDVITHKFLAQIFDVNFPDAQHLGLGARRLKLFALTQIGGKCHNLAGIGLLQPFKNNGCVETARIGQHHFLDIAHMFAPNLLRLLAVHINRCKRSDISVASARAKIIPHMWRGVGGLGRLCVFGVDRACQ